MQKIEKLNHIRAIACLIVVIGHTWADSYPEIHQFLQHVFFPSASVVGVPLFFILSGFLFAHLSHNFRYTFNFKQFVYNRVLRIFPLVVVILLIVATHVLNKTVKGTDLLDAFILLADHSFFTSTSGFGPLWSVGIEFLFYLMVPFIVYNVHKKGLKYIFLTLFFTIVITIILPAQSIYQSLFFHMFLFLSGMLLSPLYEFISNHPKKNYFILLSIAIFILLLSTHATAHYYYYHGDFFHKRISHLFYLYLEDSVPVGIFFIYIITPLSFGKPINKFLNFTAKISFSIYLLHYILIRFIKNTHLNHFIHNPALLTLTTFTLIIGGAFILAMTSYYLIEQPFLEKKVSYLDKG